MLDFEKYIYETLGIVVKPSEWEGKKKMINLLQDGYDYFKISVLGLECLVMAARDEKEETPAVIKKRMELVNAHWGGEIIYSRSRISSFNRRRLIGHKISFIVPFNQMYLPLIKIDLCEHFKKMRVKVKKISPSTQAVILYALHNGRGPYTPSSLARALRYSQMTLSRSFDELEALGIGALGFSGRERVLEFSDGLERLWKSAKEYMSSPVRKTMTIRKPKKRAGWPQAGLSALAGYSMLDGPDTPVYAVGENELKALEIIGPGADERDRCEIEVWKYPPELFAAEGKVDRFSLALSLIENTDARVESAVEEMMENIEW